MTTSAENEVETLIIGAGIGGIGYAVHLNNTKSIILEGRERHGGTWDYFKYPGIRSDSDMFTFAYSFHPWGHSKYFSPAQATCDYLQEVIDKYQLRIQYSHKVQSANFSTKENLWTVVVDHNGQKKVYKARFIIGATGYYDYNGGHYVDFSGEKDFQGTIVHPQLWPEKLDYTNKKVVVIGSGATAITLVPNMAKGGANHVTMLQRSPGYILSLHDNDSSYKFLKMFLPVQWAFAFVRWKNELIQRLLYWLCTSFPYLMRWIILKRTQWQLPRGADMKDFTPRYLPWEERLCLVPDNDFFVSLRKGSASVVTDHISRFDKTGIELKSGKHLDADVIVTATGISVKFFGHIDYTVDGSPVDPGKAMLYRGVLVSNMPNYIHMLGYTNASWTLKVDIAAEYIKKLVAYMHSHNYTRFTAVPHNVQPTDSTVFPLEANYIKRDKHRMFKQGDKYPWINVHNAGHDKQTMLVDGIQFNDEYLEFH